MMYAPSFAHLPDSCISSTYCLVCAVLGLILHRLCCCQCGWGDNCATVERGCPGVTTMKTPNGMTVQEWRAGLEKYADAHRGRA